MTTDLRDRFDDLVAGVPDHVSADAGAAWRAGSRRRTRRRLGVATSALAVAAVLLGGVTAGIKMSGPEPADSEKVPWWTVDGHPSRIDLPRTESEYTGQGNGVAGLVARDDGWYAVTSGGDVHRLVGADDTDYLASISPDGTRFTVMFSSSLGLRMYTGDDEEVGAVSPGFDIGRGDEDLYSLAQHTQAFWSPDSRDLLVPVRVENDPSVRAIVTGRPAGPGHLTAPDDAPDALPVGWLTREESTSGGSRVVRAEIGWLDWEHSEDPGVGLPLAVPRLLVTSTEGGEVVRSVPLRSGRFRGETVATATLSPFGDGRLTVTTTRRQLVFGADGQVTSESDPLPRGRIPMCPASWSSSGPAWPVSGAQDDAVLVGSGDAPVVQADPRTQIGCSVWAAQALDGSVNQGISGFVLGHNSSWLAWHWREIGICLLTALAGAGLVLWLRRRSRLAPSEA